MNKIIKIELIKDILKLIGEGKFPTIEAKFLIEAVYNLQNLPDVKSIDDKEKID